MPVSNASGGRYFYCIVTNSIEQPSALQCNIHTPAPRSVPLLLPPVLHLPHCRAVAPVPAPPRLLLAGRAAVPRPAAAPAGPRLDLHLTWSLQPPARRIAAGAHAPHLLGKAQQQLGLHQLLVPDPTQDPPRVGLQPQHLQLPRLKLPHPKLPHLQLPHVQLSNLLLPHLQR